MIRLTRRQPIFQILLLGGLALFAFARSGYSQPQYSLETRTLGQFYQDKFENQRFSFSNYLILDVEEEKYGLQSYLDGRFFTDLSKEDHQFDLYQATILFDRYKEWVKVEAGRIPILSSFDYFSLDGARFSGNIAKRVDWDTFGGWTRDTVLDLDRNTGIVAGAAFNLRNKFGLRNKLQFLFEDYDSGARDERIGLTLGRDVFLKTRLAMDGGVQFSLESKAISQGFFSADTFLSEAFAFNLMYYYEDPSTDRTVERDQIYALFADSGVHGIRPTASIYLWRIFQISPSFDFTVYDAKNGSQEKAYQVAFPFLLLPTNIWKLEVFARYAYINSPGGRLHFISAMFERPIWRELTGRLGGELVFYDKISQNLSKASRAYFETTYPITKNVEITTNFETNSNEELERELRFMFFLKTRWQGGF